MEWRGLGTGRKYVELRDAVLKYCLSNPFTRQQGWERKSGIERVREEGDFKYFQKEKKKNQKTNQCISCRRCKGQGATNTDKKLCSSRESRHSKPAQVLQEMGALRAGSQTNAGLLCLISRVWTRQMFLKAGGLFPHQGHILVSQNL